MVEDFFDFLKLRPKSSATQYLGSRTPQGPATVVPPGVRMQSVSGSAAGGRAAPDASIGENLTGYFAPLRELPDRLGGVVGAGAAQLTRLPHQLTGILNAVGGDAAAADDSFARSQALHNASLRMLREGIVPNGPAPARAQAGASQRKTPAVYEDLSFNTPKKAKPVGNQLAQALKGLTMKEFTDLMGAVPAPAKPPAGKDTAANLALQLAVQRADQIRNSDADPAVKAQALDQLYQSAFGLAVGQPTFMYPGDIGE